MSSWHHPWGRVNSGKHIISDQTATVRWKKRILLKVTIAIKCLPYIHRYLVLHRDAGINFRQKSPVANR